MHPELISIIVEEAEQACRYVAKHATSNMEDGPYRDGFEVACSVCEDAISKHIERHKDRIALQLNQHMAMRDALAGGVGITLAGKHVPTPEFFTDEQAQPKRHVQVLRDALAFYAAGVGYAIAEDMGEKADAALAAQPDIQQEVERAFLAVMNARDRNLSLPLHAWAERQLLKRRIAVAIEAVLRPEA